MALQLKQHLTLTQQLIMTPQLQQAIKLLQLSRLELLDTIYSEMETNPMLEEQASEDADEEKGPEDGDKPEAPVDETPVDEMAAKETITEDVDWESYLSEYSTSRSEGSSYDGREMPSFESTTSEKTNLYSHLTWQLSMGNLSDIQ
jgi:RNA polymerase sigma-54 factor